MHDCVHHCQAVPCWLLCGLLSGTSPAAWGHGNVHRARIVPICGAQWQVFTLISPLSNLCFWLLVHTKSLDRPPPDNRPAGLDHNSEDRSNVPTLLFVKEILEDETHYNDWSHTREHKATTILVFLVRSWLRSGDYCIWLPLRNFTHLRRPPRRFRQVSTE